MTDRDLIIIGGGPAGMMAGLLFARAGLRTLVLEKHRDFLRDFRGDTVHPSTLQLFHELSLLDALLARPHNKVEQLGARIGGTFERVVDLRHLPVAAPFLALMPHGISSISSPSRRGATPASSCARAARGRR